MQSLTSHPCSRLTGFESVAFTQASRRPRIKTMTVARHTLLPSLHCLAWSRVSSVSICAAGKGQTASPQTAKGNKAPKKQMTKAPNAPSAQQQPAKWPAAQTGQKGVTASPAKKPSANQQKASQKAASVVVPKQKKALMKQSTGQELALTSQKQKPKPSAVILSGGNAKAKLPVSTAKEEHMTRVTTAVAGKKVATGSSLHGAKPGPLPQKGALLVSTPTSGIKGISHLLMSGKLQQVAPFQNELAGRVASILNPACMQFKQNAKLTGSHCQGTYTMNSDIDFFVQPVSMTQAPLARSDKKMILKTVYKNLEAHYPVPNGFKVSMQGSQKGAKYKVWYPQGPMLSFDITFKETSTGMPAAPGNEPKFKRDPHAKSAVVLLKTWMQGIEGRPRMSGYQIDALAKAVAKHAKSTAAAKGDTGAHYFMLGLYWLSGLGHGNDTRHLALRLLRQEVQPHLPAGTLFIDNGSLTFLSNAAQRALKELQKVDTTNVHEVEKWLKVKEGDTALLQA